MAKTNQVDELTAIEPAIFTRAKEIASQYTVVLQPHARLGFLGHSLEMPNVFVDASTANKCIERMRDALAVAVAVMLEAGQAPPVPAVEQKRETQINIRLSSEEKLLLEHAAKQRGFRGVSDFVRSAALSQMRRSA